MILILYSSTLGVCQCNSFWRFILQHFHHLFFHSKIYLHFRQLQKEEEKQVEWCSIHTSVAPIVVLSMSKMVNSDFLLLVKTCPKMVDIRYMGKRNYAVNFYKYKCKPVIKSTFSGLLKQCMVHISNTNFCVAEEA